MHTNLCYRIGVISVADGTAITACSVPIAASTADPIATITDSATATATANTTDASATVAQ